GADIGWRQAYQWITEPTLRGPWNDERLWEPHFAGQAAYIVPPVANFADGPSGIAVHPGTGFLERWQGWLFLCDFRGDPKISGIHALHLVPQNSTFALEKSEHAVWGLAVTDCDFAPDGALYFTDWVEGWQKPGKGRLYRAFDPLARASTEAQLTR